MSTAAKTAAAKARRARDIKKGGDHIKDPAVKRLAKIAGCERISKKAYPVVREMIVDKLSEIVRVAAILKGEKKKRFSIEALLQATERMGKKLYPAQADVFTICKSKASIKTGVKNGNCLYVAPVAFKRLLKEIALEHAVDATFEADFVANLQFFLEQEILGDIAAACQLSDLAKRKTLGVRELQLAKALSCKVTATSDVKPLSAGRKKSTKKKASAKKASAKKAKAEKKPKSASAKKPRGRKPKSAKPKSPSPAKATA